MGKIIKTNLIGTEDLINSNVNDFVKSSTETYANYLETSPIFVTYYSKHQFSLNFDDGFESVNQFVGNESPVKYIKIEKLPIYGIDTADLSTDIMDGGVAGSLSSTAVILPDTVTPLVDDYLVITLHSKKLLFVITTADPDNINQKKFYKIAFKASPSTVDEIEKQVSKNMAIDFNQIGRKSNVLFERDYYDAIQKIRKIFDDVLKRYSIDFFDSNKSTYRDPIHNVTDQYLNKFIINNDLHSSFENFRNSRRVSETIQRYAKYSVYDKTLWAAMEEHKALHIPTSSVMSFLWFEPENTRFGFNYYWKDKTTLITYESELPPHPVEGILFCQLNLDIFKKVTDKTAINDPNLKFFREYLEFIDLYTSDPAKDIEIRQKLDAVLDKIEGIESRNGFMSEDKNAIYSNDYYFTPLVLFSLRDIFNYLTKTNTKT